MKISWIILTYNRTKIVGRAFEHNFKNSGIPADEIIWVSNGMKDSDCSGLFEIGLKADCMLWNKTNQGVARGYNQAMAMATGDYIVITGCDMLMPDNWLKTFADYVQAIPNTACACMYSATQNLEHRYYDGGKIEYHGALSYIRALPIERRIFPRKLLKEVGYLREDLFGLYGWEDVEWAARVNQYARKNNLLTYVIPGMVPIDLQKEESYKADPKMQEYEAFKKKESNRPDIQDIFKQVEAAGFPFYSPY